MNRKYIFFITFIFFCFFYVNNSAAIQAPILSFSIEDTTVSLSWTEVSDATGYIFYYAPSPYVGPDSIVSIDRGLQTSLSANLWYGAEFIVAVQAYNEQENSAYSNIETISIPSPSPPEAPQISYSLDGTNISINWNDVPDATGYILYYSPTAYTGREAFLPLNLGNQTSFSYQNLEEGKTYSVAVIAYNNYGESEFSNIETFTVEYSQKSAEGLYEGYTSSGRYITGIILDDGTFYVLYSIPSSYYYIGGVIQGDVYTNEKFIYSTNAKDFNLEGLGVMQATLSGTFTPKQTISGTLSYTYGEQVDFTASYNNYYELTPSINNITGTYTGTIAFSLGYENVSINIFSNGAVSGYGSSGCSVAGYITPRSSGNVYDISVNFGGYPCYFSYQTMNGVVFYDSSTRGLYAALPNSSRTDGILFVGVKN